MCGIIKKFNKKLKTMIIIKTKKYFFLIFDNNFKGKTFMSKKMEPNKTIENAIIKEKDKFF